MERRDVLKGGSSLMLMTMTPQVMAPQAATIGKVMDIGIYDPRYPASREFATNLAKQGAITLPTEMDIGVLWHKCLRQAVMAEAKVVGGLTTYADAFIISELSRREGFSVSHDHVIEFGSELASSMGSQVSWWIVSVSR